MSKKYYKVVYIGNMGKNTYSSALGGCFGDMYNVEYQVDEAVSSKDGFSKLFVFDCLIAAKLYSHDIRNTIVFECEITNPTVPKYIAQLCSIANFWYKKKRKKKVGDVAGLSCPPIPGTVLCDTVKITKQVWPKPTEEDIRQKSVFLENLLVRCKTKKETKPWWKFWA